MKVLVEAERNSDERARFNETTLVLESRRRLRRKYPFAYGFVLGSNVGGRDALDCFVITDRDLKMGDTVECAPVEVFILSENDEQDVKILGVPLGDERRHDLEACRGIIEGFLMEVFKEWPEMIVSLGPLLGEERAIEYVNQARR